MNDIRIGLLEGAIQKPITTEYISHATPMGANILGDGASFRVWAPRASAVYLRISDRPDVINEPGDAWRPSERWKLFSLDDGTWAGYVPGVRDGDYYRFYVDGRSQPYKRDPYARELELHGWPDVDCIVRARDSYPWHDAGFRTPAFNDLVIYQFHVGRFYAVDEAGRDARDRRVGKFLDVIDRIPYWVELGINAVEPLPVVEFDGPHSLGYNGKDIFSPEMDYAVEPADLMPYLDKANALLAQKGISPLTYGQIEGQANQLKVMIDLCHLYGIAVILDVVYNHAGGFGDDDQSIYFFDRDWTGNNGDSLYFMNAGWAGGLVFDYHKRPVREFLIRNAEFFLDEYHVDGFRYDEVSVIDAHGGWSFLRELSERVRSRKPQAIQIAEYWRDDKSWVIRETGAGGAGFDAVWSDSLRGALRAALAQAAQGREFYVDLDSIAASLYRPPGFSAAWRSVNHVENHDMMLREHEEHERKPRVAALADATHHRSWYARSRARVINGLLLTAPGIPMLFMGQEFLEDKFWSDAPRPESLIWWNGIVADRAMGDHLHFTRDLIALRRRQPALRGEGIHVFHVHEDNRVIAFHRWVEGQGRDLVVVASLNETALGDYRLGLPRSGQWHEVFNSDAYDRWPNPHTVGNGGRVLAEESAIHGMAQSASIAIPANGILVLARDWGD